MRVIFLAAASTMALSASACAPHVNYAARTTLDCPARQGSLERTSVSADRKTCTYRGSDGVDVTLQLTPVVGDAQSTLRTIEASLIGPTRPAATGTDGAEAATPAPPKPPAPPKAPGSPATDADKAAQEAAADARGSGASDQDWSAGRGEHEGVVIDREGHGVRVHGGDHAQVRLPGLHIETTDHDAKVNMGGIRIDASNDEATVHVIRDVRLRGEAFSREKRGVRATFIARRDNLPDGYSFVGYQAGGPKVGPLTVAMVRSRETLEDDHHLYRDIKRLVRRNSGA